MPLPSSETSTLPRRPAADRQFTCRRTPWALLLGGAAAFAGLECVARLIPPEQIISYEASGDSTWPAVRRAIDAFGAPEIAIVGSSRTREVIVLPRLRESIGQGGSGPWQIEIASYASPAATAEEVDDIVRLLVSCRPPPRLIIYGVEPMQLSLTPRPNPGPALWRAADWVEEQASPDPAPWSDLPGAIRNDLERMSRAFAAREGLRHRVSALLGAGSRSSNLEGSPLVGGYSRHQQVATRALTHPETGGLDSTAATPVGRLTQYPIGGHQVDALRRIMDRCIACGSQLVLFEVPLSPPTREAYSLQTVAAARRIFAEEAGQAKVIFLSPPSLEALSDPDFDDAGYLLLEPALRFTEEIASMIPGR